MGVKNNFKKKEKINIYPLSMLYIVFVFIIAGSFILMLNIGPILVMIFEKEYVTFLNYTLHKFWLLLFYVPAVIFADCMYIKSINWKVSFTKTHLIIPKIPKLHEKDVEILCAEIIKCEATMNGFYYFFTFTLNNGKKNKLFITRFSFKQMEKIIKMIQDRGGLIGEKIIDIIAPLRFRMGKNKHGAK